ncbi:MAG: LuxR C-terminal-related transcriptional regulator [Lautropia sp.]
MSPAVAADLRPSFARTKIQLPRASGDLVERPQLEARLGAALSERPLTLLIAPAGWGKTSALARQCGKLDADCRVIWVSLDEDDDVPRFLACLSGALAPLDLPWHVSPAALPVLAQGDRGLRAVSDEIVNALAEALVGRGLLVFDDVHRVNDARIVELLAMLVEHVPPSWGVVIASRSEPALPLARLRVSGRMAEFRQGDLRFRDEEVAALLRQASRDEAGAAALVARAEGWAAGLRLMLSSSSQGAAMPGAPMRHVFDYLAEEVLDAMAPEMRRFLVRCSVLPELTPARCAQVSGMPAAASLFDEIERQGLFVTALDASHQTLRLHDLFRDFLEARLVREEPGELPALLVRAADGEDDLVRALTWLARAEAWGRLADRLLRHGQDLIHGGRAATVEKFLALCPGTLFGERADLHLLQGLCHFNRFAFDEVVASMAEAATAFDAQGRRDDAAFARVLMYTSRMNTGGIDEARRGLSEIAARDHGPVVNALAALYSAWVAIADNDPGAVTPHYASMVRHIEASASVEALEMTYFQMFLVGYPGIDPWMARWERLAAVHTGDRAGLLRTALAHVRAGRALAAGRLDDAAQWLDSADDDIEWLGSPVAAVSENAFLHIVVDAVRGDAAALQAPHDRYARIYHATPGLYRAHAGGLAYVESFARWLLHDDAALQPLADEAARLRHPHEWRTLGNEFAEMAASAALARGDAAAALAALRDHVPAISCTQSFSFSRSRLLLAETYRALGRLDDAAATLRPWLADVIAGGACAGAVLAGPRVMVPLAQADWAGRLDAAERECLARMRALAVDARAQARRGHGQDAQHGLSAQHEQNAPHAQASVADASDVPLATPAAQARSGATTAPAGAHPHGLSARELEVLTLLAAGDSNKVIARRLDLSPHTVKRHVANILGKLGVDTRGQAAAAFRAIRS